MLGTESLSNEYLFKAELEKNGLSGDSLYRYSELFDRCLDKITSLSYRKELFLYLLVEEVALFFDAIAVRIDGNSNLKRPYNILCTEFKAPETNIIEVKDENADVLLKNEYGEISMHFHSDELRNECLRRSSSLIKKAKKLFFPDNNRINGLDTAIICPIKSLDDNKVLGTIEIYYKLGNHPAFNVNNTIQGESFVEAGNFDGKGFEAFLKHLVNIVIKRVKQSEEASILHESINNYPDIGVNKKKFFENSANLNNSQLIEKYRELFKPMDVFFTSLKRKLSSYFPDLLDCNNRTNLTFAYRVPSEQYISFFLTSEQVEDLLLSRKCKPKDKEFAFTVEEIKSFGEFQYMQGEALIGYVLKTNHSAYFPDYSNEPVQQVWAEKGGEEIKKQISLVRRFFKIETENRRTESKYTFMVPIYISLGDNKKREILVMLIVNIDSEIDISFRKKIFDLSWEAASIVEAHLIAQHITETKVRNELELLSTIGKYAAVLVHELKTPLLLLSKNLVKISKTEKLSEGTAAKLLSLLYEIDKAKDASQKLYVAATSDTVKHLKLSMENFDIRDSIDKIWQHLSYSTNWYIKIDVRCDTNKTIICGDRDRIEHVIRNLLANSFDAIKKKYEFEKNIVAEGKIVITISADNSNMLISVEDNGCGIKDADKHKIFDKFYSTKSARKELGGLGLGLASSKAIIEDHGGKMYFDSELGKGSKFLVSLPFHKGK